MRGLVEVCFLCVAIVVCSGCGNARNTAAPAKTSADSPNAAQGESRSGRRGSELLVVLAAASTTDAVEAVARQFEQQFDCPVKVSPGPSNTLAAQILSGAPADLFLSAHEKWTAALDEKGLVLRMEPLLTNDLVLVVPKGNPAGVTKVADLLTDKVHKVALAGENVPAGMYAQQALTASNVYQQLTDAGKIARGQDVRVTLSYVERGEAEAGVVYSTDAQVSRRVEVAVTFDPSTFDKIVYPLALLKNAQDNEKALQLFEYLQSAEAQSIFEKNGFKRLRNGR